MTFDLRHAFTAVLNRAGDTSAGEGEGGSTDDTGDGEDSTNAPTEEELRNPRIKTLHDEAARYRNRAKTQRERAEAAEAKATKASETIRNLALRTAFNEAARHAQIDDVDAAWKLAADDVKPLTVGDDGSVDTGALDSVVKAVASRHPGVFDAPDNLSATLPSGRRTNGRKTPPDRDTTALGKKFPALRHGR